MAQLQALKRKLTIVPKKFADYDDGEKTEIFLYRETEAELGIAREYLLQNRKPEHQIDLDVSDGDMSSWPGPLRFNGKLKEEQQRIVAAVMAAFNRGELGGLIDAPPGTGKTVMGLAIAALLQRPTLVVVHKTFLVNQWKERIAQFLPDAKVGIARQTKCDFEGKHIVIGMIHSLAKDRYGDKFKRHFGLTLVDETHRVGSETWAGVVGLFPARHRIGLSGTLRRKDGAENAFYYHIGPVLAASKVQSMRPLIKRVFSSFRLVQTANFNPNLAPESLVLTFLCANEARNRKLVELMFDALKAGRKILVLGKRLKHLARLESMLQRECAARKLPGISTGQYVGGQSEDALYRSAQARAIFATSGFASEGLDIPALDTLFLVNPMGDVQQAVGRVTRFCEGKKTPIVVDVRDDAVPVFKAYGHNRDRLYRKLGWEE